VRNNITKVDISNISENQSVTVGKTLDFNRVILNTDAGKGKSSEGITRWDLKDDTAGAGSISESGAVLPTQAGSFSVRAVCFQSKEKYKLWLKDKESNQKYITAASNWYTVTVVDTTDVVAVATQSELDNALLSKNITQITIQTDQEINFTISEGDYANTTLIVDAPNADIQNYANFKNIIIKAIKENTWRENAEGNSFHVTSVKVRIIVNGTAEVKEIIFDSQDSVINLVVEGTVHQITLLQPSLLNLSGSGEQIPITIEQTAEGSRITTSIPLNLECNQNSEIILNSGAEGSTINKTDESVEIKVENNSDRSVVITTNNIGEETVNAGESRISEGTNQPSVTPAPPSGGGTPAAPVLSSISVKAPAAKTVYFIGEELDITGLVIEGTYSDLSKKDEAVTIDNITGFDSSSANASQILTVTIGSRKQPLLWK
jgi:hypothetical protein